MRKSFWRNKKVLVTGFEGFLGSNLTKRLIKEDAKVIGLDIKTRRKKTVLTADDYKKMLAVKGSVCNRASVQKIIKKQNIEIIFHLAAKALVGECLRNPENAFATNIQGTWNILECSRRAPKISAIIVASSDKAYGEHKKLPYRENAALIGKHPYDVSKSCADLLAHAYYHTFGLPIGITRCGNIYGPGDFNLSRLIPGAVSCVVSGKIFEIRSDGKFVRDYIHVDDVVSGYLKLAEQMQKKKLSGQAFNFSNEKPMAVIEAVKKIYGASGKIPNYKVLDQAKYEIKRQYLSAQKARKILNWKPQRSFSEGIKNTLAWHREFFGKNGC